MMFQYLASHGYVVSNGERVCIAPTFMDLVNQTVGEGTRDEKIVSMLELVEKMFLITV
jgi:hypothetical protein